MNLSTTLSKKISGRTIRHALCLLLASVMAFQPVSTVAYADADKADSGTRHDDTFHYVAIGDSVAAGFDLETNTMFQNVRTYFPQLIYNNSSDFCYPSLTAKGLTEILGAYGIIGEGATAECTNFGFAAYRVENFLDLINDPDFVIDFNYVRDSFINAYTEEKESYDSLQGAAKDEFLAERKSSDHDSLEKLLSDCYNDEDPENNQYMALLELSIRYGLSWHTIDEFRIWYEANIADGTLFEEWFDDWHGTYLDDYYPRLIHGEFAKLHDLFIDNIADADLISLDIGSNNMLYNYLVQMTFDSIGTDATPAIDEKTGLTYYKNINNPLNYIVSSTASSIAIGEESESALEKISVLLELYRDEIDLDDIIDVLYLYSYDTMKSSMLSYVAKAMELTPELADSIEEISKSNGKKADIMYISRYAALGRNFEMNRTIVALCKVMRVVMDRVTALLFGREVPATDNMEPSRGSFEYPVPSSSSIIISDTEDELLDNIRFYDSALSELRTLAASNAGLFYQAKGPSSVQNIIRTSYEEKVSELIDEAVDNLLYNLVYLVFGRTIKDVIIQYNEQLRSFADERGYIFVDIFDIPNDMRLDPHPMSDGHRYIANQILAAADSLYASKHQQDTPQSPNSDAPESQADGGATDYSNFISNYFGRMGNFRKMLTSGQIINRKAQGLILKHANYECY